MLRLLVWLMLCMFDDASACVSLVRSVRVCLIVCFLVGGFVC